MEDLTKQIESLKTELRHWEEQFGAEETAKEEANTKATATIDGIGPKLRRARRALEALISAREGEQETLLAELEEDIDDLRDAFRRLDEKAMTGGPPLS